MMYPDLLVAHLIHADRVREAERERLADEARLARVGEADESRITRWNGSRRGYTRVLLTASASSTDCIASTPS